MFWDNVAGVYDVFVNVINRKTHRTLRRIVSEPIKPRDEVLECACGTGLLSKVIAAKCKGLTATDFSTRMLKKAKKNCTAYDNITYDCADISALVFPDAAYDKVVAGNVIHLLDEPLKALKELNRVCRPGGKLIIPTYMNKNKKGKTGGIVSVIDKTGAAFKRQFTVESYRQFFLEAGYTDVTIRLAEGKIPCAVAVMSRKEPA